MEEDNKDPQQHGILKNISDDKGHKPPSHIHFDEATIQEHDKLRGTRQKIEEPKTPFHYEPKNNDKLNEKSPVPNQTEMEVEDSDGEAIEIDDEPLAVKELKHIEFENKRKRHYNEFTKAKELLGNQNVLDEEDD